MKAPRYLIVMAKAPVPGAVKTRLLARLSRDEAARLYRCLLLDTLDVAAGIGGVTAGVAYDPPGSLNLFRRLAPRGFLLLPQPAGGLGRRLSLISRELFRRGAGAVCLMNSDGPDLPASRLRQAFGILRRGEAEVVFGPGTDGGYYLVGLSRAAAIFGRIPWSTAGVLGASLRAAGRAGLSSALLAPWPDLDEPEDLPVALARWERSAKPPRRSLRCLRVLLKPSGTP